MEKGESPCKEGTGPRVFQMDFDGIESPLFDVSTVEEDDVSLPDDYAEDKQAWFVAFVRWHRMAYHSQKSKLDPKRINLIEPGNEAEDIFLNFLKYYDKYVFTRDNYARAERKKMEEEHPIHAGTDYDHHSLAMSFIWYGGPDYFRGNSDVKGKSKEELIALQNIPVYPDFSDIDSD